MGIDDGRDPSTSLILLHTAAHISLTLCVPYSGPGQLVAA